MLRFSHKRRRNERLHTHRTTNGILHELQLEEQKTAADSAMSLQRVGFVDDRATSSAHVVTVLGDRFYKKYIHTSCFTMRDKQANVAMASCTVVHTRDFQIN